MKTQHIENCLISILSTEKVGIYRTSYQICDRIKIGFTPIWNQLTIDHPANNNGKRMGKGTGNPYSIATFVSQALSSMQPRWSQIKMGWLDSHETSFNGIQAGNDVAVSIWKWDPK